MDTTTTAVITAILTSSVVSGIFIFVFQTVIKGKIDYHFQSALENVKAQLSIQLNQEQILINRRNEAYPAIVALVYRTRNMARDLVANMDFESKSFMEEFSMIVHNLEEALYKYRIDLERDKCFKEIHEYKNALININLKISNIENSYQQNPEIEVMEHKDSLESDYKALDQLYNTLITILSSKK